MSLSLKICFSACTSDEEEAVDSWLLPFISGLLGEDSFGYKILS